MKGVCEKCGKELGFFERSLKISNSRINIQYDALCSDCHQTIKEGIDQVDAMYQRILRNLNKNSDVTNMAAVPIDLLIFFGIEALLVTEPNYYSETTSLNQTIINRSERMISKQNDMARIVYKTLSYGFSENLDNWGLGKSTDFIAHMLKNILVLEQIAMNCSEEVPKTYVNAFFTPRGFIMERIEKRSLVYVTVPDQQVIDYVVKQADDSYEFEFTNLFYSGDSDKTVKCTINGNETADQLKKIIDRFNSHTTTKEENKRQNTIKIIKEKVIKDLAAVKPEEKPEKINLDCVLLCAVKNFYDDPEGREAALDDPEGLFVEFLMQEYPENLKGFNLESKEEIAEYIKTNTHFTAGFSVKYEKTTARKGWGFFTNRGYIVGFEGSKRRLFVYTDEYPNDLYFPCNEVIYNGRQYLQLPMEEALPGEFREFDGLIFFSGDVKKIADIGEFFNRNNLFYQMDNFVEVEEGIYNDPEQLMEVKRISDRLFRDFGYLPFCLYDEWYAIQEALRDDDLLMKRLIPEKKGIPKKYGQEDPVYASKIIKAFKEGAKELQTNLNLQSLSIAKGILWCYFKESLMDALSKEWVRIGGDFVAEGDDMTSAFMKYAGLTGIEPEKTYYIGLFIYYLMERRVLPDIDFLDNYERAVQTFIECRKNITAPKQTIFEEIQEEKTKERGE